ncbi:MAG: FadR/GntR family transcriptional regulator [Thermomicrobiales bacterium]
MEHGLKPLARPVSLHESVQEAIRAYIVANALRPGEALPPEGDLARQLGVSRNSVREAVKALESLGILEARRGSGLFVAEFSFDPLLENLTYGLRFDLNQLAELLEVRRVLETGLIGATMAAMSPAAHEALRQTVEQMRQRAEANENIIEADRQFHQILFEPLGNTTLLKLLDVFWRTYQEAARTTDMRNDDLMGIYRGHAAIQIAVQANDVERARQALDQHYDELKGRLARIQGGLGESPSPGVSVSSSSS